MTLPPLYKYLDVKGAKLTLGTGTFKHAKPSDFKDTDDLTVAGIFPEGEEAAATTIGDNFSDLIVANINRPPTSPNLQMRRKVALIQQIFRSNPGAAAIVGEEMRKNPTKGFDLESLRALSKQTVDDVNAHLQNLRVLCVTTHIDSEKMWSEYAESHKGIALRIEPNIEKDSKFQLFKPVTYRVARPSLYDDALHFLESSIFADQEASKKAMMDKIIYSKTLKWKDENEYRLVIALRQNEEPWNTRKFHPEEVTELYLGAQIDSKESRAIIDLANALNPKMKILQAYKNDAGKILFESI